MKNKFSLAKYKDPKILSIIDKTDKKTLARWSIDCVERVMHYFEREYPNDERPRTAINTLKKYIDDGIFSMKVIRKASLDSHAAARKLEDTPAKSAARAAGQCVATAHVKMHSIGGAMYALQAIYRDTNSFEEVEKERKWQYNHLLERIHSLQ